MPPRRRGPICFESNPDCCPTPGSTGVNDIANTRNNALLFRTPRPQGTISLAEGGAMVLAQVGGGSRSPHPQQNAGKTKRLKMPKPAADNRTKRVRNYAWKLFGKAPQVSDVHQQTITNCGLAGLLAALANTGTGRHHLQTLFKTSMARVETDVSGVAKDIASPPSGKIIKSTRYFTVSIDRKTVTVSGVLYTDDADHNWSLIYMTSPNKVLWPIIAEKAFAKKLGGYAELSAAFAKNPLAVNDYWKQLCGSSPQGFTVNAKTKRSQIRSAAKNAVSIPTIAASKTSATKVTGWHTFTILKLSKSRIKLYDPLQAQEISISEKDFRDNFEAILYGDPKK